ncbi:MAG: sugar ABC transporter permease [Cellulomonadaceae bacterium]|jgi:cellobiose transport system permease protein|nr:sugar ABC transporter permease [Cellulomonadaceae bacterium]
MASPLEGTVAQRAPRRVGIGQKLSKWDVKVSPYLYISPFFIMFAIFGLFPIVFNIVVALHEWHRRTGMGAFRGLQNFQWVLEQPRFWNALENTFSIWLIGGIPQLIFALFIAAVLDQNLRAKTFWRMSVLVPYVVMPVATAMIFGQIFATHGLVVPHLQSMGLFTDMTNPFFVSRWMSHVAIATMGNFQWTGYNALIFLAAMQAVPRELYEAATVDGAGRLRQFFSVTIPSIRPTMVFVILTMTIGGLQVFDTVRLFDASGQGGSNQQWETMVLYLYNLAFGDWQNRLGEAAAVGWLFAIVIIVFTLINFFLTRRISGSEAKPSKISHAAHKAAVDKARESAAASEQAARDAGVLTTLGDVSRTGHPEGFHFDETPAALLESLKGIGH